MIASYILQLSFPPPPLCTPAGKGFLFDRLQLALPHKRRAEGNRFGTVTHREFLQWFTVAGSPRAPCSAEIVLAVRNFSMMIAFPRRITPLVIIPTAKLVREAGFEPAGLGLWVDLNHRLWPSKPSRDQGTPHSSPSSLF